MILVSTGPAQHPGNPRHRPPTHPSSLVIGRCPLIGVFPDNHPYLIPSQQNDRAPSLLPHYRVLAFAFTMETSRANSARARRHGRQRLATPCPRSPSVDSEASTDLLYPRERCLWSPGSSAPESSPDAICCVELRQLLAAARAAEVS